MNNVNAQCCNEEKYLKYRMFDMSWVEVKEWLEKTDTVIVPVGSIEQHGPALPCGVDSYAGYYVCLEAAVKADVPVAPLMPYGYSCMTLAAVWCSTASKRSFSAPAIPPIPLPSTA